MEQEGPLLEALTRRLAECPAEFLAEPRIGGAGTVHVAAVVSDLIRDLGGAPLSPALAEPFQAEKAYSEGGRERNALRVVLIAAWLLYDPWFRSRVGLGDRVYPLLAHGLVELAGLIPAPRLVTDPDRREELARLCLKALGLRPAGESAAQAQDRLTTLSSVERQRVIREARAAEERARQIREAMARKAAQEAAARYSRE